MLRLCALLVPLLLLCGTARGQSQAMPEPLIMFNPHGSADIMDLWSADAPWQQAQTKVQTLILVHWWLTKITPDQIKTIVDFANAHAMKINLSVEAVMRYPGETCGFGEGYAWPGELGYEAGLLKAAGGVVDHVEIDEPLWFGAYATDPTKCHYSVAQVIARTAAAMNEVLAVYPNVSISEIEPVPGILYTPTWSQDLAQLQAGLANALSRPVSVIQLDVNWADAGWPAAIRSLRDYTSQRGMGLGIIYNGSPVMTTDTDWIKSAIANMEGIEGGLGIVPEVASFQTWNPNPTCNLPETSAAAMTWWINRYFRPRSQIQAQLTGRGARGTLTAWNGVPIPNVTVRAYRPGTNAAQPLTTTVLRGTAPPNAVSALLAVRLNSECGCDGDNDVLIGTVAYQEISRGANRAAYAVPFRQPVVNGSTFMPQVVGGTVVTRVIAKKGQAQLWNSVNFPVTPAADFVLTVPAATMAGAGWYGNVNIIWLDASGNGITRTTVVPPAGKVLVSSARTAADGSFALSVFSRAWTPPFPSSIEFDGANDTWRPSVWTPAR